MSAQVMVTCDQVHAERVPPKCRAFLVLDTSSVPVAYERAEAAGWTQDVGNVDSCPSCSRALIGPGHPDYVDAEVVEDGAR